MMTAVLEECGASTSAACSAAEAFEMLALSRPHVLLSDLGMPGEDGYSLIRRVRALPASEGGEVPAIAITGFAGVDDRKRAIDAGSSGICPSRSRSVICWRP